MCACVCVCVYLCVCVCVYFSLSLSLSLSLLDAAGVDDVIWITPEPRTARMDVTTWLGAHARACARAHTHKHAYAHSHTQIWYAYTHAYTHTWTKAHTFLFYLTKRNFLKMMYHCGCGGHPQPETTCLYASRELRPERVNVAFVCACARKGEVGEGGKWGRGGTCARL
jgi:hypothetical protein